MLPAAAPTPIPPSAPPAAAAGDAAALSSLRSLAIDTLCDLMRRGQANDGRRQAATTALRYLSQLDRLAQIDRVAAQRRAADATTPTSASQQDPAPARPEPPGTPRPELPPRVDAAPAFTTSTAPLFPAQPAPARDPASLPSRAELESLLTAVRDTAATAHQADDPAVAFTPALGELPALHTSGLLAHEPGPRFDPRAALPAPFPPGASPTQALQSRRVAAALLSAVGLAPSG